jgi:hypothetical protein
MKEVAEKLRLLALDYEYASKILTKSAKKDPTLLAVAHWNDGYAKGLREAALMILKKK